MKVGLKWFGRRATARSVRPASPPRGQPSTCDSQGSITTRRPGFTTVLRYHPETNTFGVMDKDGSIRTMFKPAPRSAENPRGYDPNKYKTPLEYFYDQ